MFTPSTLEAFQALDVDQFGRPIATAVDLELIRAGIPDWHPRNDDPIADRLKRVDGTLVDLNTEAGEKWTKLEEAKAAIGKVDGELTAEHPAFVALDEAGKSYGALKDKIVAAENVKAGLIDVLVQSGQGLPQEVKGRGRDQLFKDTPTGQALIKAAGQRIIESDEYKRLSEDPILNSNTSKMDARALGSAYSREETKALLTAGSPTSAGAFNQPNRLPYVGLPLRPLTLLDLITIGDTDSDSFEFVRMTSFTNAAAPVAEATSSGVIGDGTGGTVTAVAGGRKPESAMAFEVVKDTTRTIAHWLPMTRKALKNAGQLRTMVDFLLSWGLDAKLEAEIGQGDGSGEHLLGLFNQTGTNSIPAGPRSKADKIHMGMTQVRLDLIEPTGNLIHPIDWEDIRLSRENDDTGAYLFGPPAIGGAETLWGKPVAVSASAPQGTGMTGAFAAAHLLLYGGTQVYASDSHMDFFTRNLVAILAELDAGFYCPIPYAFSEVNFASA